MKTKKNENKFGLRKITIANLTNQEMRMVQGGSLGTLCRACSSLSVDPCSVNA